MTNVFRLPAGQDASRGLAQHVLGLRGPVSCCGGWRSVKHEAESCGLHHARWMCLAR